MIHDTTKLPITSILLLIYYIIYTYNCIILTTKGEENIKNFKFDMYHTAEYQCRTTLKLIILKP